MRTDAGNSDVYSPVNGGSCDGVTGLPVYPPGRRNREKMVYTKVYVPVLFYARSVLHALHDSCPGKIIF